MYLIRLSKSISCRRWTVRFTSVLRRHIRPLGGEIKHQVWVCFAVGFGFTRGKLMRLSLRCCISSDRNPDTTSARALSISALSSSVAVSGVDNCLFISNFFDSPVSALCLISNLTESPETSLCLGESLEDRFNTGRSLLTTTSLGSTEDRGLGLGTGVGHGAPVGFRDAWCGGRLLQTALWWGHALHGQTGHGAYPVIVYVGLLLVRSEIANRLL